MTKTVEWISVFNTNEIIAEWNDGGAIIFKHKDGGLWWSTASVGGKCWVTDDGSLKCGDIKSYHGAGCHGIADSVTQKEVDEEEACFNKELAELPKWKSKRIPAGD